MMVVAWFSRAREFRADAGGAALAGRGNMIARAAAADAEPGAGRQPQPQLATLKINGGKRLAWR